MKTKLCININKILPNMKGYALRRIDTTWDDEDYCKSYSNYYIAKDEVVNNVFICAGTFSRTMILSLSNGKKVELWGKNTTQEYNDDLMQGISLLKLKMMQ